MDGWVFCPCLLFIFPRPGVLPSHTNNGIIPRQVCYYVLMKKSDEIKYPSLSLSSVIQLDSLLYIDKEIRVSFGFLLFIWMEDVRHLN